MFCQKCGAKLADDAKFCSGCGASMGEEVKKEESKETPKVQDNEVILKVKSTFKTLYQLFGGVITFLILIAITIMPMIAAKVESSVLIVTLGGFLVAMLIFLGIPLIIGKMQYKAYAYNFYKTKVIYRDSFLNVSEKEVKYKHIREVTYMQTFVQRWFHIGTIILYTNAETGFGNGIFIRSVENPKEVYEEIKKIINA